MLPIAPPTNTRTIANILNIDLRGRAQTGEISRVPAAEQVCDSTQCMRKRRRNYGSQPNTEKA